MPSFCIRTLGCVKNQVDSDEMAAKLFSAGFSEAKDGETPNLVIINTCSFLQVATEQSIDLILETIEEFSEHPEVKVVVSGCLPSRYESDLERELPEVAAFVDVADEADIARVATEVCGVEDPESQPTTCAGNRTHEQRSYAFIKISDGCNRYCSFCAIPYIRGPMVSRPVDAICAEMEELTKTGAKELVFVAQDPAGYGRDLNKPATLAELLSSAAKKADELGVWLRVLYLQPDDVTEELIRVFCEEKALLPYFDIPFQHTQDHVLKSMGRKKTWGQYAQLVEEIKERIPSAIIRTTALVGYPGETKEDVASLIEKLRQLDPHYLAVFPYSQEDGTRAAKLASQVSEPEKLNRYQDVFDLSQELGFSHAKARVGEQIDVLVDGFDEEEGLYVGHAWFQAPDTDGVVYVDAKDVEVGKVVRATVEDAVCFDLFARLEKENV